MTYSDLDILIPSSNSTIAVTKCNNHPKNGIAPKREAIIPTTLPPIEPASFLHITIVAICKHKAINSGIHKKLKINVPPTIEIAKKASTPNVTHFNVVVTGESNTNEYRSGKNSTGTITHTEL